MSEKYRYTLRYKLRGGYLEEDCEIRKDTFFPYGEVKAGQQIRGQYGFMEIIQVFYEPNIKYGKFIAAVQ